MNIKIILTTITLTATTSIHAGWLDKLTEGTDKVQQKIKSATETVKGSDAAASVKIALSNEDIVAGLKEALNKGAGYAVDNLGQSGGFMKNAKVKIPMPDKLNKVESILRKAGKDKYADDFITTMNRAAESAVPLTLDIIKQAVTSMSFADAKNILQGSDDAATQYLKKTSGNKLSTQILPIVKNVTSKTGVTASYKKMVDKLGMAGKYINRDDYDIDDYVTQKTVAGLFTMIAVEEKKIRDDPAARTTDILKSVFGVK